MAQDPPAVPLVRRILRNHAMLAGSNDIGNPPYVEYTRPLVCSRSRQSYATQSCGNVYTAMVRAGRYHLMRLQGSLWHDRATQLHKRQIA